MNNTMLFITALVFNTIALKLISFVTEIKFQKIVKGAFIITIGIVTILYLFSYLSDMSTSMSKTVDNSQSSSCSDYDMKRLARERASLNGRVLYVNKISMGNFNYSAQFYPKNRTGRWGIWLKIECINGKAKVTDAESFKVD